MGSVSLLLERSERPLLDKVAALEQAGHERDEKERAQRELALREEALHRARELETLLKAASTTLAKRHGVGADSKSV